jgi:LysR family transcriptional regulator, regulator for metE and metH
MKNLQIRHLELIKHIVEEGSMSKATEKMHLTQSALSHQLRELEKSLDLKIFERHNKKLVLTQEGIVLLTYSNKVLDVVAEMNRELSVIKAGFQGMIRISTECYTSYHWLPALIKKYQQIHPEVKVEVIAEATRRPVSYLEAGKLDIAITEKKYTFPAIFRTEPLFSDEFVLVVSADSDLAKIPRLKAAHLHDAHLILYDVEDQFSTVITRYIKPKGITLRSISRLQLTEGIIEMVAANLGITIMPTWIAGFYKQQKNIRLLSLQDKDLKRTWYAISRIDAPAYLRDFVRLLQRELKQFT